MSSESTLDEILRLLQEAASERVAAAEKKEKDEAQNDRATTIIASIRESHKGLRTGTADPGDRPLT